MLLIFKIQCLSYIIFTLKKAPKTYMTILNAKEPINTDI